MDQLLAQLEEKVFLFIAGMQNSIKGE